MNKMSNFNGMPYKKSGRAGGKSVSMVGMLVLLLAALLVLPSCTGTDTETVTETVMETVPGEPVTVPGEPVTVPGEPVTVPGEPVTVTEYVCPDEDATKVTDSADCPPAPDEMCEEGTEGDDDLEGGSFDDYICGLGGNDTITAGDGADTLEGGADNDTIYGGAGNDVIKGEAGDDKLYTGIGNDRVYGGEGNDELIVQGGNNMLDGGEDMDGEDMDIAIYMETGGVSANLATQSAKHLPGMTSGDPFAAPGGGEDTLMNIENVRGSNLLDRLTGDGENNRLEGWDGADTISGGAGNDTIIPNRPMPPATADPDATGTDDRLAQGETAPVDAVDIINGGDGVDTVSYAGEAATFSDSTDSATAVAVRALAIDLSADPTVVQDDPDTPANESIAYVEATLGTGGDAVADRIVVENKGSADEPNWVSTIENVVGGAGADSITGDEQDNVLEGGAGADALAGGAGVDVLYAGVGDTALNGGSTPDDAMTEDVDESMMENDTVSYAKVTDGDTTTEGNQGITLSDTAAITNVENLVGTSLGDTITVTTAIATVDGGVGDDTITGFATGRDMIMGGAGNDTLSGGGGGDTPAAGFDKSKADVLVGGPGNDTLTGTNDSTEVFAVHAGGGNDTINMFQLSASAAGPPVVSNSDPDHLHIIDFTGMPDCTLQSGGTTVFCDLPGDQRITINVEGVFTTSPLDLAKELKIVAVPPES